MLSFTCKFQNWSITLHYTGCLKSNLGGRWPLVILIFFVGSKVKYVGQRSNEVKCNNLSLSSITLHLSACLKPDLGGRCLLVILIFLWGQRSGM